MHTRHCLKIADRIHLLLVRELGQGLDRQRMVREPLYARDVLLVCDAMRLTDAPFLAMHFRRCAASPDEAEQVAARRAASKGRGFSASRFLNSLFGVADASDGPAEPHPASKLPNSTAALRAR
jgi:hypothetical protein